MRILFSTGSPAGYMAPPALSSAQVNCGPDWLNATVDGYVVSLATPLGEYDLAQVAQRLPTEQRPDAVVCLVDSARRAVPRNLAAFRCPKVLLVADTHHLVEPLRQIIHYARSEPFDRIVLLYSRHHWEFFREAGLHNLYWFPGLTFPHHDDDVIAARVPERLRQAAFVGQTGICHPRRVHLLSQLGACGLPLVVKEIPQREALALYGRSLLGINVLLNGDLNLRVLEILSSGAMLLTDELVESSGLSELRAAGCGLVTYGSPEEMAERAKWALDSPGEAQAIGQAGARWFDRYFNAALRRKLFEDLALHGTAPEAFALPQPPSVRVQPPPEFPWTLVEGFEYVQELHRNLDRVTVALDPTVPERFAGMCRTLPRLTLRQFPLSPGEAVTFLALGRTNDSADLGGAAQVWFWDGAAVDRPALAERCTGQGLAPVSARRFLFCRQRINTHQNLGAVAMFNLERGDYQAALVLAKQELEAHPNSVEGLLTMLDLGEEAGKAGVVQKFLSQLAKIAPHHPRFRQLQAGVKSGRTGRRLPERLGRQARASAQCRRWPDAERFARHALKLNPHCAEAHSALGLALDARAEGAAALHHLGQATVSDPANPDHWYELGLTLRRHARTEDALAAMIQAAELGATRVEIQLALAACALTAGHGAIATEALAVVERLLPGHPLVRN